MDWKNIGNVYDDYDDNYYDVNIACPEDEAPQIYLSLPRCICVLRNETVCIWITQEGIEVLKEVVCELENRIEKLGGGKNGDR